MVGAIILAVIFFLFVLYLGTMFPEIQKMGDSMQQLLENPAVKAFLGSEGFAFSTYEGFMKTYLSVYWGLGVGGFTAFVASSYLAGEIERKTSDLLLSLPISRVKLVLIRYAAIIPMILGLAAAVILALFGGAAVIGQSLPVGPTLWLGVFMVAFALAVASIGMLISAVLSDSKQAMLITLGLVLVMYFMQTLGSSLKGLEWISNLSLFNYFDMGDIMLRHVISYTDLGVLLGIAIVILGLAVFAFNRRDINIS